MTLPLLALSDDEAAHYAAFDPAAAEECARRSAAGHGSYLHEVVKLRGQVEELKDELEDANDRASETDDLNEVIKEALEALNRADAHMSAGQLLDLIQQAITVLVEAGDG